MLLFLKVFHGASVMHAPPAHRLLDVAVGKCAFAWEGWTNLSPAKVSAGFLFTASMPFSGCGLHRANKYNLW